MDVLFLKKVITLNILSFKELKLKIVHIVLAIEWLLFARNFLFGHVPV